MFKCKLCGDKFVHQEDLLGHLEDEHNDDIPKDFTISQYYYALKTGKTSGSCIVCHMKTKWNDKTQKYHRFCEMKKCKDTYIEQFRKNMIGAHGKVHLLNDPDQQKKMLANRSISGKYTWSDGTEFTYTGSYELDFLKFLDLFMEFPSSDVMCPSPHVYYYMYKGEEKFYIPDVFIPSLDLEIEIKDGGDNPNNHHKIQEVDKVKEKLKDDVLTSQTSFNYIKLVNKGYAPFFMFLNKAKSNFAEYGDNGPRIFITNEPVNEPKGHPLPNVGEQNKQVVPPPPKGSDSTITQVNESALVAVAAIASIASSVLFISEAIDVFGKDKNGEKLVSKLSEAHSKVKQLAKNAKSEKEINEAISAIDKIINTIKTNEKKMVDAGKVSDKSKALGGSHIRQQYFDTYVAKMEKIRDELVNKKKVVKEAYTTNVSKNDLHPVFILMTYTDTTMAKLIRFVTQDPYSHASISFDSSLHDVYSFGRKQKDDPMKFINEDITEGVFKDVSEVAEYSMYVMFVDTKQLQLMKKRLNEFKKHKDELSFNFVGLFNVAIGRETDRQNEYFCSQFVAEIISAGAPDALDRDTSLYTPYGLKDIDNVKFVARGKLKYYDPKAIDKKVAALKAKI